MQCVILCGGLGTRMAPWTADRPKALIDVAGKPFLGHQLQLLAAAGISRVLLSIGHLGEQIRDYAGDGERWGMSIDYVSDGPKPLGTGGALRQAAALGRLDEAFFLLYGDSYLPIGYRDVWEAACRRPEPVLLTVLRNNNQWDTSNICFAPESSHVGRVTHYQKATPPAKPAEMVYVDYGLSVYRRATIVQELPTGEPCDLSSLLTRLSRRGEVAGYLVSTRFYEVGSPQGLRDFEQYLTEVS